MVPWKKTLTIPSLRKNDHRTGLDTPFSKLSWLNTMSVDPGKSLTSNHGGRSHQRMRPLVAVPNIQTIPQLCTTNHRTAALHFSSNGPEWSHCAVDSILSIISSSDGIRWNRWNRLMIQNWNLKGSSTKKFSIA